jgi:transcriptional regulator with XRE-family HTH domain
MTRAEKVRKAQGLRAEGWLFREIADYMGVAIQTVDSWLNDPDGSRLRARKESYCGSCELCGAPTDGSNGRGKAPRHCAACWYAISLELARERAREHREAVEAAWAAGLTCAEMCARFGWTQKSMVCRLRARGYNLPHRRSPEQVARISAGWHAAREARRELHGAAAA